MKRLVVKEGGMERKRVTGKRQNLNICIVNERDVFTERFCSVLFSSVGETNRIEQHDNDLAPERHANKMFCHGTRRRSYSQSKPKLHNGSYLKPTK